MAHHSYAEFDLQAPESIRGTVVAFEWISPHVSTRVAVEQADGSQVTFVLEGMSPDYLGRRGWNRRTLTEDAAVELDYYPLKSGEPGGLLIRVRLVDGTVKVMINEPRDSSNESRGDASEDASDDSSAD